MASPFAIIEDWISAGCTALLESVPCNLCGSTDAHIVYDARTDVAKDPELSRKFRASGDELLTQLASLAYLGVSVPATVSA